MYCIFIYLLNPIHTHHKIFSNLHQTDKIPKRDEIHPKNRTLTMHCYRSNLTCFGNSFTAVRTIPTNLNPRIQANGVEPVIAGQAQEFISFHEALQADTAVFRDLLDTIFYAAEDFQGKGINCILRQARWLLPIGGVWSIWRQI